MFYFKLIEPVVTVFYSKWIGTKYNLDWLVKITFFGQIKHMYKIMI